MKVEQLLDLWLKDGYNFTLELHTHRRDSDWDLFVTQFEYMQYEYRRHYGILVESVKGEVKRSRILEFDRMAVNQIEEIKNQAENIIEMNWKTPAELEDEI